MSKVSIIFATTKTSASGSMVRILKKIASDEYTVVGFGSELDAIGGVSRDKIPKENFIVLHNQTQKLKEIPDFENYKYIVNFRDPRDRMCNSYYWMQQHPQPGDTQDSLKKRAEIIKSQGINDWVIKNTNINHERHMMSFVDSLPDDSYCISTYAALCLDFDKFIQKMADFIGIKLTDKHWRLLESERIESLSDNKEYIGNKWKGSDLLPGRFERELNDKTIAFLNYQYYEILIRMSLYDKDFSSFYEKNLEKIAPFRFLERKIKGNAKAPDILREVALAFENAGDIKAAFEIMQKALELRPSGPFIKRKVDEYTQFLQEKGGQQ